MEYNKLIAEMSLSDEVEGFYVLKAAYPKTTATGKPFLSASLSDRSGSIEIKVWDYSGPISSADEGNVVKIRGTVSEFRGTPQITVDRIRLADDNDTYDLSALVPVAPIDVDTTMAEVERLISSITDADYRKICSTMMARHKESLKSIPAAKSVHHGFISGLLMHTATMMKTADFLAGLYGDIIDRSLLLAGTFLHDFAKESEFTFSQLGLVTEYSVKGQLLGHLVMGAQEVSNVAAELGIRWDAGTGRHISFCNALAKFHDAVSIILLREFLGRKVPEIIPLRLINQTDNIRMDLVILLHEERVSKHTPTGQIPSQVQAEIVDRGVNLRAPIQPKRFMAVLPREIPVMWIILHTVIALVSGLNGFSKFFLIHNTIGRLTMVRVALYFAFPEYDPLFL